MLNKPMRDHIVKNITQFRLDIEITSGHVHLYEQFNEILKELNKFQVQNNLDEELSKEIIAAVDLMVTENDKGRRPWDGCWEVYFTKCLNNSLLLLREFTAFPNWQKYCPMGYCNRFLHSFRMMDNLAQHYDERDELQWVRHFGKLAAIAAEMFEMVADEYAEIVEELLEHPDDRIFSLLLSAYSKTKSDRARELLGEYLDDEENWVRELARNLLSRDYSTERTERG